MGWQPDEGGHWLLVERLGVNRALEFLIRKEIVSADEAAALVSSTRWPTTTS